MVGQPMGSSALSLVTSRCGSHTELRAGFGERWCAYQPACRQAVDTGGIRRPKIHASTGLVQNDQAAALALGAMIPGASPGRVLADVLDPTSAKPASQIGRSSRPAGVKMNSPLPPSVDDYLLAAVQPGDGDRSFSNRELIWRPRGVGRRLTRGSALPGEYLTGGHAGARTAGRHPRRAPALADQWRLTGEVLAGRAAPPAVLHPRRPTRLTIGVRHLGATPHR